MWVWAVHLEQLTWSAQFCDGGDSTFPISQMGKVRIKRIRNCSQPRSLSTAATSWDVADSTLDSSFSDWPLPFGRVRPWLSQYSFLLNFLTCGMGRIIATSGSYCELSEKLCKVLKAINFNPLHTKRCSVIKYLIQHTLSISRQLTWFCKKIIWVVKIFVVWKNS